MSQGVVNTAQHLTAGATIAGGGLSFLAEHSTEITSGAVVTTAVFSIAFGIWNARIQSQRNKINKRNLISDILQSIEDNHTPAEIEKIKKSLRK